MLFGSGPLDPNLLNWKWNEILPDDDQGFTARLLPNSAAIPVHVKYSILARQSLWVTAEAQLSGSAGGPIVGHGSRLLSSAALRVAFAEAWERFIAKYVAREYLITPDSDIEFYAIVPEPAGKSKKFRPCKLAPCSSSNGFAAGSTLEIATQKAVAELFERHCVLAVWNMEYKPVHLKIMPPFWAAPALSVGWKIYWFNFGTSHSLITVACLAIHEKHGARFDACAAPNTSSAVRSTGATVLRMIYHLNESRLNFDAEWLSGEPISHFIYYLDPARLTAFDFIIRPTETIPFEHQTFDPEVIPLWIGGELPAVARAQLRHAKELDLVPRLVETLG